MNTFVSVLDVIFAYTPLMCILLFYLPENECKRQHKNLLFAFMILFSIWYLFCFLVHDVGINKNIVLGISCFIYVTLTYIRRKYKHNLI